MNHVPFIILVITGFSLVAEQNVRSELSDFANQRTQKALHALDKAVSFAKPSAVQAMLAGCSAAFHPLWQKDILWHVWQNREHRDEITRLLLQHEGVDVSDAPYFKIHGLYAYDQWKATKRNICLFEGGRGVSKEYEGEILCIYPVFKRVDGHDFTHVQRYVAEEVRLHFLMHLDPKRARVEQGWEDVDGVIEDGAYDSSARISVNFVSKKCVGLCTEYYAFTGGSHGNSWCKTVTILLRDGRIVTVEKLAKPGKKQFLFERISQACRDRLKDVLSNDWWFEGTAAKNLAEYGKFTITEYGISLIFNPYEIASYSEGYIELFIPYQSRYLKDVIDARRLKSLGINLDEVQCARDVWLVRAHGRQLAE